MKRLFLVLACIITSNFGFAQSVVIEYLDINDIYAGFLNQGDMFWNPDYGTASFEYPKGTGKHANFGNVLWIGGKNRTNGNLHMAAQGWRSVGSEYWPGPLDSTGQISQQTSAAWNKIWKINKSTIDSFLSMSSHTLANTPNPILTWPAKGNIYAKTPANTVLDIPNRDMAPFVDINNDGIYNPLQGDYPRIKGEQMLWWIMNDKLEPHLRSQSPALSIEIHAMAYGCTQTLLKNIVFLELNICNKGTIPFDSTIVSLNAESDLGYAFDDFIGFDSTRRMGISYNGDAYDETLHGYGYSPPQVGTILLAQPTDKHYLLPTGAFTYFNNSGSRDGSPANGTELYHYMTGRWRDGAYFQKDCDPLSNKNLPYPYVFTGNPQVTGSLSEPQCNRSPSNRRFVLSSQPFTLDSNQSVRVQYAFLVANMGGNPFDFTVIKHRADLLLANPTACGGGSPTQTVDIAQHTDNIIVYPNPSSSFFVIEDASAARKNIILYNSVGEVVYRTISMHQKTTIQTNNFASGVYYLKIDKKDATHAQPILIKE